MFKNNQWRLRFRRLAATLDVSPAGFFLSVLDRSLSFLGVDDWLLLSKYLQFFS